MARLSFLPTRIVGGESIWISASNSTQSAEDITLDDYSPATGWGLTYSFSASTPISVSGVANDDDSGWTLELTGAQTLTFTPGVVAYQGYVTKTIDDVLKTITVDSGTLIVDASPARVSSWAAVLVAVDAAIATYAANPNGSITVDGMSVSYRSMDDLIKLRDYVNYRLNLDSAGRTKRIIRTRFP